jgi:hypothetical protein
LVQSRNTFSHRSDDVKTFNLPQAISGNVIVGQRPADQSKLGLEVKK